MSKLDDILPTWQFREIHHIEVRAPADQVMRAVDTVTWAEAPLFRLLMTLAGAGRHVAARQAILRSLTARGFTAGGGFAVLARSADEVVIGVLGAFERQAAPRASEPWAAFDGFAGRGYRAALNFRFANNVLWTETRVLPTDAQARRLFGLYWLLVRVPSGLTRRLWLQAIRQRVLRTASELSLDRARTQADRR